MNVNINQEAVTIKTRDHAQYVTVQFANGGIVTVLIRSLGGHNDITVKPEAGQTIAISATDEGCCALPLALSSFTYGSGEHVPEMPLPLDRHTIVVTGREADDLAA